MQKKLGEIQKVCYNITSKGTQKHGFASEKKGMVINMTKAEKIERVRGMKEGYTLFSACTKLPFVECEQGSFYDQFYLFDSKEEAHEAAKRISENGDPVGVAELKTVEYTPPRDEKLGEPVKNLLRNQVREQLMRMPLLGVNAVFYKPEGEHGEVLELDSVLPQEVMEHVDTEKLGLEGLRLTGMYFAQYLRRTRKDMGQLRDVSEEFHANLVRAQLLLPVIPPEDQLDANRLDLVKCQLPSHKLKKASTGEEHAFLTVFTNMEEILVFCRNNAPKARVVRVAFEEIPKILREPLVGCILDPFSLNIPVRKEDIPTLVEALKK